MKLKTQLLQLNSEEDVCIGSRSAFFFIGKPQVFLDNEHIFNDKWYKTFVNSVRTATIAYNNLLASPPDKEAKVTRKEHDFKTGKTMEVVVPFEDVVKDYNDKLNQLQDNIKSSNKRIEKFKPLSERTVRECYRSIDNDKTIILVKGDEMANFWLKKEFNSIFGGLHEKVKS